MPEHASPLLRVSVVRSGDTVVVGVDGELDCASAPDLERVFDEMLASQPAPRRVVVDAERLSFVDVAGLRPLLRTRKRLGGHDPVRLRNASPQVVRVLRLLDLADYLGLDG